MESSTRTRLQRYGLYRLITSWDFIASLVVSIIFVLISICLFTQRGKATFIESGTGTAQTLTTVILTAVIILVSISDDDLLVELIEDRNYESILFSFEYTVALSITTSVIGSIIQSYSFGNFAYAIFSFLLFYTVFASLSIVSKIITLGHKKAQQTAVGEIDDDIGDDVEIIGPDGKKRESIDGEPIEEGEK